MCAKYWDKIDKAGSICNSVLQKGTQNAHMHYKVWFSKILPNSLEHGVLNIEDGYNTALRQSVVY